MTITTREIFGALFTLAGASILVYCFYCIWLSIVSRHWPSATGLIAVSDLETRRDTDGRTYRAKISFVYTVAGREYIGNHALFGDRVAYSLSGPALRLQRKYRPGSPVRVLYDPSDPTKAVLESRVATPLYFMLLLAPVFIALGYMALRSAG
jgi:hypothetical protein